MRSAFRLSKLGAAIATLAALVAISGCERPSPTNPTPIPRTKTTPTPTPSATPSPLRISSVQPNLVSSDGGDAVVIAGAGFEQGAVVKAGDAMLTITSLSSTEITATTPPHPWAIPMDLTVTNPDGRSAILRAALGYSPPNAFVVT